MRYKDSRNRGELDMARPIWDEDVSWQETGLCRDMDPEIFFSTEEEPREDRIARERRAKDICAQCPALAMCREFALSTREPYGVWGGMTEGERRRHTERQVG